MTEPKEFGHPRAARIDLALLLLRLVLAAVFGAYGASKWAGGLGRLAGLMMSVGIPLPDLAARVVAGLEVGGAILLLAGLWTRVVGVLLAIEMTVAIWKVVWRQGFVGGYSFELTLLTVALSLAIAGGGAWSIGRDRLSR
jgi:putative oxidoreductase